MTNKFKIANIAFTNPAPRKWSFFIKMAEDYSNINTTENRAKNKYSFKMPKFNSAKIKFPDKLKHLDKRHLIIGGLIVILIITFFAGRQFAPNTTLGQTNSDKRTEAPAPLATQELNKSFEFPLTDDKGKEVAKIKYLLNPQIFRMHLFIKEKWLLL